MPNEKPLKVIDCINRFEVLEILNKEIRYYIEPPVDLKKLELLIELRLRVRDLPSIDEMEVR